MDYPISGRLEQEYIDFLDKVNSNRTEAIRIIIRKYMVQQRFMLFEKYMLSFAMGVLLIGVGTVIVNLYISLACIFTGVGMVLFSIVMYTVYRVRFESDDKEKKTVSKDVVEVIEDVKSDS